MSSIEVNGTRIYYEKRGRGPAVLFVSGATGDAGHWTTVADILADAYTVITYDRRGNSRSPRPPGWTSTTIGEQADDTAALLRGLELVPAIVFGTSAAAHILADLYLRHPDVLQAAIFHEPAFPSDIPNADAVRAARQARVEEGWPGVARALRWSCTCAGWRAMRSMSRSIRSCANGCSATRGPVRYRGGFLPRLRAHTRPARSDTSAPRGHSGRSNRDSATAGHWRYEATRWLAAHFRTTVIDLPGAHMGYLGQPEHFARALRPILDRLT